MLGAAAASKDHLGGSVCLSDFSRNPQMTPAQNQNRDPIGIPVENWQTLRPYIKSCLNLRKWDSN